MKRLNHVGLSERLLSWLNQTLSKYGDAPAEFFSDTALVLYGLWFINPWFGTFANNTNYGYMRQVAPEWAWGLLFVTAGLSARIGLATNRQKLRRFGLFWVLMFRLMLFGAVTHQTHGTAQGVPEFFTWSCLAGWCYLRAQLKHSLEKIE